MIDPIKVQFRPGINRETTDYANTGGWYDINLARWVILTPQSMGGWQRFTTQAGQGMFRSLFPWATLSGSQFYGAGTNLKYYLIRGNQLVDITPDDTRRGVVRGRLHVVAADRVVVRPSPETSSAQLVHFPRLGYRVTRLA